MRRSLSLLLILAVCAPLFAQTAAPATPPATPTPAMYWQALLLGNKQFVAGSITYGKLKEERKALAGNQYPPMTILACSDSRVPPELVFNQSLGTLFVVRSAGNVADTFALASIEYAITEGWTSLIVVLGHENCGAIKASLGAGDPDSPNLLALVTRIRQSFVGVKWDPKDKEAFRKAVEANTRASATALLAQSKIIRDAAMTGKLKIVTAVYDLETGEVRTLD
jgi:carbonic anhydrase